VSAARALPRGFAQRDVECNGTRLHVAVGGAGDPVVLLHGWPETSAMWHRLMGALAERGWQVIAPDLRGLGTSQAATGGYGKDHQAEDVRQLLEQLDVPAPVRLVGHDIGGMVAFSFARLHPERVAALALLDLAVPGLGLERAMDVAAGGLWHFGLFQQPDVPAMLVSGHEQEFFAWWFADQAGSPDAVPDESIEAYIGAYTGRERLDAGFGHYRTLLEDGRINRAWAEASGTLAMPVLAAGGEHSAGSQLAEALSAVAPHVQGHVIAGAGHFVVEERPEEALALLQRFLEDQK
jgi:pimeloyl-ACP methyl ester carboxylesterase